MEDKAHPRSGRRRRRAVNKKKWSVIPPAVLDASRPGILKNGGRPLQKERSCVRWFDKLGGKVAGFGPSRLHLPLEEPHNLSGNCLILTDTPHHIIYVRVLLLTFADNLVLWSEALLPIFVRAYYLPYRILRADAALREKPVRWDIVRIVRVAVQWGSFPANRGTSAVLHSRFVGLGACKSEAPVSRPPPRERARRPAEPRPSLAVVRSARSSIVFSIFKTPQRINASLPPVDGHSRPERLYNSLRCPPARRSTPEEKG